MACSSVNPSFLSTPSARRATFLYCALPGHYIISIHALREEGDSTFRLAPPFSAEFLSTPSARRATHLRHHPLDPSAISIHALREEGDHNIGVQASRYIESISIHALREEGDPTTRSNKRTAGDFYPRPPRGGRRPPWATGPPHGRFLSTPSARRATGDNKGFVHLRHISIHALREEGDCKNGEKHLRFCFIIKRSAQIWKSLSKNIRKKSRDLHRTA